MTMTQDKVLNAIKYFVKNTHNCRKTKLFKLLYFLDFIHFKKYGTTVTGYTYIAMPRGPVPIELYEQITKENLPEEFKKNLSIYEDIDEQDGESRGFKIVLKGDKKTEVDVFTPNEMKIMNDVSFMFKDATAKEMSEITHLKNSPWDLTIKTKGKNAPIDLSLALDSEATIDHDEAFERLLVEKSLRKHALI